jgi:hypothetical protein
MSDDLREFFISVDSWCSLVYHRHSRSHIPEDVREELRALSEQARRWYADPAPTGRERALLNEIAAREEVQARLIAERDAAERAALAPTERERARDTALRAALEWMEDVELSDHDILRDDAHNAGFYMTLAMVRRALLSAPPAPTEEAP